MSADPTNDGLERLTEDAAGGGELDLGSILVIDRRILGGDSDPASELARQMGEALSELTVEEWTLLGAIFEQNAA